MVLRNKKDKIYFEIERALNLLFMVVVTFLLSFIFTYESFAQRQIHSISSSEDLCKSGKIDCIYKNGRYEPFYPDINRKVGDFVNDGNSLEDITNCNNTSGLSKDVHNMNSVGNLIKTSLLGKHARCVVHSDENPLDKSLNATGQIISGDKKCISSVKIDKITNKKTEIPCTGTGSIVDILDGSGVRRKFGITAAHIFIDQNTKIVTKHFLFIAYVWIPPSLRKNPNVEMEARAFRVKRVYLGTANTKNEPFKDYAFFELDVPFAEEIGGITVPKEKMVRPYVISNKAFSASDISNKVTTIGYHEDNDIYLQKNCKPFGIFDFDVDSESKYWNWRDSFWYHDQDTLPGSSGSPILLPSANEKSNYLLTAIHIKGNSDREEELRQSKEQNKTISHSKEYYNVALRTSQLFDIYKLFIEGKLQHQTVENK